MRQIPNIDYDHSRNPHSTAGAESGFRIIESMLCPHSVLDVGCGTGTWLRAALRCGITDVFGIDGVDISDSDLLIPRKNFQIVDLTQDWTLGRKFDVVLCLEVAEHLDQSQGAHLIAQLTAHADTVVFSAAIPGQRGQHHVNCQWPEYWQNLFNRLGYSCCDAVRWALWNIGEIEPWYCQNCMVCKYDPQVAGKEARIQSVIHPEMVRRQLIGSAVTSFSEHVKQIDAGAMNMQWYLTVPMRALFRKLRRRILSSCPMRLERH